MLDATVRERMAASLHDGLAQFIGTDGYHRLSPMHGKLVATDGVKYLCEAAGAFWLIDAIASHQPSALRDPSLREIQFWRLQVNADRSAVLEVARDDGDVAFRQQIEFTDFPLDEQKIWVAPGGPEETYVAMLPSEN